jgi:hypothetical protein
VNAPYAISINRSRRRAGVQIAARDCAEKARNPEIRAKTRARRKSRGRVSAPQPAFSIDDRPPCPSSLAVLAAVHGTEGQAYRPAIGAAHALGRYCAGGLGPRHARTRRLPTAHGVAAVAEVPVPRQHGRVERRCQAVGGLGDLAALPRLPSAALTRSETALGGERPISASHGLDSGSGPCTCANAR